MLKKIFSIFIFILLLVAVVQAYMPETHLWLAKKSLESSPNSPVGLIIQNNFEDYMSGVYLTDASVFYYFSEGFTSIGKEYKATHSPSLCRRAVELASNDKELAFAYGICNHHVTDSVSHNEFIPKVIERTNLVNGLVHVFAEEKVNDEVITSQLQAEVKSTLINTAPIHREFFIEITKGSNIGDVDVGKLYDAFISEVSGSSKYSVGFRNFTAVPTSIHIVLILIFLISLMALALIIRKKGKNIFNWVSITWISLIALVVIFAYILYFTNTLWMFFQWGSYPISITMPTSGWESSLDKSISETVKLMNNGAIYVNSIQDPAGSISLTEANSKGTFVRLLVIVLSVLLTVLFGWLNFRKIKRRKK